MSERIIKIAQGLTKFPQELYTHVETLEQLDLSGNALTELPSDMYRFRKLKIIFLSNNQFTQFPSSLYHCPVLEMIGIKSNQINHVSEKSIPINTRWLILTDNKIERLPSDIGLCTRLQKCMLAGNALSQLPESMQHCQALELLRLSANQFDVFPSWLFDLPRLAWLALSGNPCTPIHGQENQKNKIDFRDLVVEELLGEGASGFIYKVRHALTQQAYALKIFKGHVTSDGYSDDERKVSLQVGAHENLVEVVAELIHHPEGKKGLLCKLIPTAYKNLGQPPSFETCTRDVFPNFLSFTKSEVDHMILQMRNVVTSLHEQGIMHGDIYAHNVLYNHEGHLLLGDMGAATFFKNTVLPQHQLLKIEERALRFFEEDLQKLVR